jgi:hypothetical protein
MELESQMKSGFPYCNQYGSPNRVIGNGTPMFVQSLLVRGICYMPSLNKPQTIGCLTLRR